MNAHAAMMRYPRAPLAYQRASLRSPPSRRRQAVGLNMPHTALTREPANCDSSWLALSRSFRALSGTFTFLVITVTRTWKSGTTPIRRIPVDAKTASRLAVGALTGAMLTLAIVNNQRSNTYGVGFSLARNETVVYRQVLTQKFSIEDEGEPAGIESEESMRDYGKVRRIQSLPRKLVLVLIRHPPRSILFTYTTNVRSD